MTLALNFIVNNWFVFKLELMESFGSTRYDGTIGPAWRDANMISVYEEEITAQISWFSQVARDLQAYVLALFKAN